MHQNPEKFEISLKVLIKNNKSEYLLLKSQPQSKYFHGKYDLPGGRVNKEEINADFHRFIDREIKEEVGNIKYQLRADPVSLAIYPYQYMGNVLYILFEAKYLSGRIKISGEHTQYLWQKIKVANLKKLFHPSLRKLFLNYLKWNKIKL